MRFEAYPTTELETVKLKPLTPPSLPFSNNADALDGWPVGKLKFDWTRGWRLADRPRSGRISKMRGILSGCKQAKMDSC